MVKRYLPIQGDIVDVQFDSTLGDELKTSKPGLIISNNILSKTSPFVWIVPISQGKYPHPFHIHLDQRTISNGSLFVEQPLAIDYFYHHIDFIEKLPQDLLEDVLYNVRLIAASSPT